MLECVRIMKTNCKYTELFAALFVLDATISNNLGTEKNMMHYTNMKILDQLLVHEGIMSVRAANLLTQDEQSALSELVGAGWTELDAFKAISISKQEYHPAYDPYVISTFKQYIKQKKKINILLMTIRMILVSNKNCSSIHLNLLETGYKEYSQEEIDGYKYMSSRINLLSVNIFKLFPNINEITINTTGNTAFNLLFFLENISWSSKWKQIEIQDWNDEHSRGNMYSWNYQGGWIANLWKDRSVQLKKAYRKKGLTIKFTKTRKNLGPTTHFLEKLSIKRM